MKKTVIIFCLALLFTTFLFSNTLNDAQIIPSDSFLYNSFLQLQTNTKYLLFTNNTPISVGELKFYLKQFDYDSLDDYGRTLYDTIYNFLYTKDNITGLEDFHLSLHPQINLEGYYKTNKDLPWSFNYYFRDYFFSTPLEMGFGDNFAMGANFFLGKSYIASSKSDNFWNFPLDITDNFEPNDLDFYFPNFAYAGFGKVYDSWGYNVHIGKQGKSIGQTLTGSIIYNKTFETDAYIEFDVFTPNIKYTTDVVQVSSNRMDNIQQENTERYLYIHQFDIKILKNLKFSLIEGSLIAQPFSIRFLNPLPFMHQFGGWTNYVTDANYNIYKETNFCADFAYMIEYVPIKNLRLYGIYNQIEMQLPWERKNYWGRYYPNSIGLQIGADYNIYITTGKKLNIQTDFFYNSPYMYIKQTPSASLYRKRQDMQSKKYIYSWIGSPYGPDCIGGELTFSYFHNDKWNINIGYTFIAKGKNDFDIFTHTADDNNGNTYYDYYPSVIFKLQQQNISNSELTNDQLAEIAESMGISGTPTYTNQFLLKGTYFINPNFELNGQIVFNYTINSQHHRNNNKFGVEFDLAVTYKFL